MEQLKSYDDANLEEKYLGLTSKICEKFSAFMVTHMIDNKKKFKSYLNKREIIFKILKRLQALLKSCVIFKTESKKLLTNLSGETTGSTGGAQQRSLLGFFHFNSSQNIDKLKATKESQES